jgi:Lrp/AsnC family leucine-responsive transcriptional regulator
MDAVDRAILRELVGDARISNRELALRVGLSEAQCSRRLHGLREAGIILRYTAILDPTLVDRPVEVLTTFKLASTDATTLHAFEAAVAAIPAIVHFSRVAGSIDYYAVLYVENVASLDQLLGAVFSRLPGIARFDVSIVVRTIERSSGPNLRT